MILPALGTFWIRNYHGIAWTQPGGPNTTVFPQQNDGLFLAYPIPGQFISEAGEALWHSPCGHGFDSFQVFRDFDSNTGLSVAVICCPLCSVINQYIEPYERISDMIQVPIIVG